MHTIVKLNGLLARCGKRGNVVFSFTRIKSSHIYALSHSHKTTVVCLIPTGFPRDPWEFPIYRFISSPGRCHSDLSTTRDYSLFAIFLPKIIKIGGNLTKLWQKTNLHSLFETLCIVPDLHFVADSMSPALYDSTLLTFKQFDIVKKWHKIAWKGDSRSSDVIKCVTNRKLMYN